MTRKIVLLLSLIAAIVYFSGVCKAETRQCKVKIKYKCICREGVPLPPPAIVHEAIFDGDTRMGYCNYTWAEQANANAVYKIALEKCKQRCPSPCYSFVEIKSEVK